MDNVYEISLLLDFYGQLLTERQQEVMDLHYNNDYSLGEIAEYLNISRQGVYDNIKRGKMLLNEMEQKLRLVQKFSEQKNKVKVILEYVNRIDESKLDGDNLGNLIKIREGITDIIENI